jgi:Ca2+-binding RTX toxin-like protein
MKLHTTTLVALSLAFALPPMTASAESTCGGRAVTIEGTEKSDDLVGTSGPDVIAGLDGNDTIDGLGGADIICDGFGADEVDGAEGNDVFVQGDGGDSLVGGTGSDLVSYAEHFPHVDVDLEENVGEVFGSSPDDLLEIESATGTDGDDTLIGDGGPNVLVGRAGSDIISGDRGNDSLYGKRGSDRLRGGSGNDRCESRREDRVRRECERTT